MCNSCVRGSWITCRRKARGSSRLVSTLMHVPLPAASQPSKTMTLGRHPVMPGQPLVEKRIAGVQKIRHRPVLAQDVIEEQAGLGAHRVAQLGIPFGELLRI